MKSNFWKKRTRYSPRWRSSWAYWWSRMTWWWMTRCSCSSLIVGIKSTLQNIHHLLYISNISHSDVSSSICGKIYIWACVFGVEGEYLSCAVWISKNNSGIFICSIDRTSSQITWFVFSVVSRVPMLYFSRPKSVKKSWIFFPFNYKIWMVISTVLSYNFVYVSPRVWIYVPALS